MIHTQFKKLLSTVLAALLFVQTLGLAVTALDAIGSESNPYLISTAEDLVQLAEEVNGGNDQSGRFYKLTADIDLSDYSEGEGWEPIGNAFTPNISFRGAFNGNGHVISNLKTDLQPTDNKGLFGIIGPGGIVADLGLVSCNIYGNEYVGGIAGQIDSGTVENCYLADVYVDGKNYVGGITGFLNNGTIKNCYFKNTGASLPSYLRGEDYVGGITGFLNNGRVENSYVDIYSLNGNNYTGGIAGGVIGALQNCYSASNVNGSGDYTGGIAGYISGTVDMCYATGSITGNNYTGGIGGNVYGLVGNCYFSGAVEGNADVGGIAGSLTGALQNCYSTSSVNGSGDYTGGIAGYASGTIDTCYATGSITGTNYAGGIAGNGTLQNCVALNPTITGSNAGRITGDSTDSTLENNFALESVLLNGITVTSTDAASIQGADKTSNELQEPAAWSAFTPERGWSYTPGELPVLINVGRIQTGSVAGKVTDGTNPVEGVHVSLTAGVKAYTAITAADGTYRIAGVPVGTGHAMSAEKDGYQPDTATNITITTEETTGNVDFVIIPNITDVTVIPYTGIYDGQPHNGATVTGALPGDIITYSLNGAGYTSECPQYTNAGSYALYVKIERAGHTTWISGELTAIISRAAGTVAITSDLSKMYDGHPVSNPDVLKNSSGEVTLAYYLDEGGTMGAQLSGPPSDIGTYWVKASLAESENYTSAEKTKQFVIAGNITAIPYMGTYDGKAHNAVTLIGTIEGDIITYSVNGTGYTAECPQYANAGSYTVYARVEREGYPVWTSGEITAVISPAAGNISITSDLSKLYDETAVSDPSVNKTGNGGVTFTYYLDNAGIPGAQLSGPPAEIGVYWVKASLAESGNYTAAEDSKKFTIKDPLGSEDKPYLISTAEQLAQLALEVNGGDNKAGKYYKLTNDIDLSGYSEGEGWTPIGIDTEISFNASFNGNGYEVKNLTVKRKRGYQGLFGSVGSGGKIENLGVTGCTIKEKQGYVGAIAGYAESAVIKNCYSAGSVSGSNTVGGIAGLISNTIVENCYSDINVEGDWSIGGIIGRAGLTGSDMHNTVVKNCHSTGDVIASSNTAGGVVAELYSATVINCYSTGDVIASSNTAGGVVGYFLIGVIENCHAEGDVSGTGTNIGGIVGQIYGGTVTNCYNTGNVSGISQTGGIVGGSSYTTLNNCYNTGNLSGNGHIGGIAGLFTNNAILQNCYSTGRITAEYNAGGIVGTLSESTLRNCYSTGDINGIAYTGGIAGLVVDNSILQNCYSTGGVTGEYTVGGIAGVAYGTLKNCLALNLSVSATEANTGRVAGLDNNSSLESNFAWKGMKVNGTAVTSSDPKGIHGADQSGAELQSFSAWSTFTPENGWSYTQSGLPVLTDVGGVQDGTMPSYILLGAITGTVTDGINPVEGAAVSLTVGGTTYSAVSGPDGTYCISGIPAGREYALSAVKEGCQPDTVLGIAVISGETTANVNFVLTQSITGITVTPYTGVYDGSAHGAATVLGALPGDTISYSVNGADYSAECPQYADAGSYTVYVKVEREGYTPWISGEFLAVINRAAGSVTFKSDPSKMYDGTAVSDPAVTKKGSGEVIFTYYLNNGGSPGAQLSGAPAEVGTYWVKASLAESKNYTAAEALMKFTIEPKNPCNLFVSDIRTLNATVYDGDNAQFYAIIRNASSYASQGVITVDFYVDGALIERVLYSNSIKANGMAVVTTQKSWKSFLGSHTCRVVINANKTTDETSYDDNILKVRFKIFDY